MSDESKLIIMSGGQTGVDRGALDAAIECGIPHGGYCPKGRIAEDGVIPSRYNLVELDSADYRERTKRNVLDSDGTLVLFDGGWTRGTALTIKRANDLVRPVLALNLSVDDDFRLAAEALLWLIDKSIRILNVGGTRESLRPGIEAKAKAFVTKLIMARLGK